jgi:hypothetical protein
MSQPYMEIYNPVGSLSNETGPSFHVFPQFPTELRLKIWRHALERPRIIKIFLTAPDDGPRPHQDYDPRIGAVQHMSKLFRVTRESREAALSFYRVHIPYNRLGSYDRFGNIKEYPCTLYFNPEYDYLQISARMMMHHTTNWFADFLHDLKNVYDPRQVGLLNLIYDYLLQVDYNKYHALTAQRQKAISDTIAQLQEVLIYGGRSHYDSHPQPELFINRSFPVSPISPTFDRLSRDPRPIEQDLKRVPLHSDPRIIYNLWRHLLRLWGIEPAEQTSYKYLYGTTNRHSVDIHDHGNAQVEVYDRDSAKIFLEKEDHAWKHPPGRESRFDAEDLETAVKPAFGFWIFPIEAFGPLNKDENLDREMHSSGIWDMSAFWPELLLASIP